MRTGARDRRTESRANCLCFSRALNSTPANAVSTSYSLNLHTKPPSSSNHAAKTKYLPLTFTSIACFVHPSSHNRRLQHRCLDARRAADAWQTPEFRRISSIILTTSTCPMLISLQRPPQPNIRIRLHLPWQHHLQPGEHHDRGLARWPRTPATLQSVAELVAVRASNLRRRCP